MPQLPDAYVDVIWKLISSIVVLGLTMAVNRILRNLLKVRVSDAAHLHTLHMLARNATLALGSILILFIWLGAGSSFTVAMGILGAGIAFASQELIGSFAGYVNIVTGSLFHIGDRVRIGNVVGDVMDISILRTTVMEIGEWVRADQYTGRIVTVANRVVFSDPVFNYTQSWGYLWDEIRIPVTYESDWRLAVEIMLEHGRRHATHLLEAAHDALEALRQRYPIQDVSVEPALYVALTDNWIELTLRYAVEVHERRQVQARLHQELLQRFESEERITVASTTVAIVDFPPLGPGGGTGYA